MQADRGHRLKFADEPTKAPRKEPKEWKKKAKRKAGPESEPNHRVASSYDLPCILYHFLILQCLWNWQPLDKTNRHLRRKKDRFSLCNHETELSSWNLLE